MVQDFQGANLQGRSFEGKNLTGTDFSHANLSGANFTNADIRGAKFTKAILRNVNFNYARAGLQQHWIILLVAGGLLLSVISGVVAGVAGLVAAGMFQHDFIIFQDYKIISGLIVLVALAVFIFFTIQKGFLFGLVALSSVLGTLSAVLGTLFRTLPGVGAGAFVMALAVIATLAVAIAVGVVLAVTKVKIWILALVESLAVAVAIGLVLKVTANLSLNLSFTAPENVVNQLWKLVGAENISRALVALGKAGNLGLFLAILFASILLFLGGYTGWYSLSSDEKFSFTRGLIIALAARSGTTFEGSNLTEANFTGATLKNTDLRAERITRTDWSGGKEISLARVGKSYLQNANIRELVITKKSINQNFDGYQMRGVNLSGAKLVDASFIEADLSEANLIYADLSRARLVRTLLNQTNFTGATITGAFIEDWGITSETILDEVKCDYIYMHLPTKEDPDPCRKPDNREEVFAEGDFADFIYPLSKTLDLYHDGGVDPRAIAIAFHQLVENHPEAEIEIVSMERRGVQGDKFLIKAKTAPGVDRSQLSAEYFSDYKRLKEIPSENLLRILAQKDHQIRMLTNMVNTTLNRTEVEVNHPQAEPLRRGGKRVALIIGDGAFDRGFSVILQIGEDGALPSTGIPGRLDPNLQIIQNYQRWQSSYAKLGTHFRAMKRRETQVKNVSIGEDCRTAALMLEQSLNSWLNSETFHPIQMTLSEELMRTDEVRIIVQTEDNLLRRLPWHLWDWFERYRKAEVALGTSNYRRVERSTPLRNQVRILAVLGDSRGINTETDRQLLKNLPDTETVLLVEPSRTQLDKHLRDELGWDILCFAGHSESQPDGESGWIYLNDEESLTIEQLKNALSTSIERGLKMAIFNSCDGLGLARRLALMHIPQMIVMREPVPDRVAQEFLQNFLTAFSGGKSLYASAREAREMLQTLEDEFPCATWLPVVCQNPSEVSWTWQEMREIGQLKVQEVLKQLEGAIAADVYLTPEDKAEALEQVQVLVIAAQNPTEKEVQRLGKTAIRYLRGMVDELPNTARLVGEFNRLLPKIAQLLGLG
ncbi:pentapeptide repeat-containing protein [Microcoleus sp. N3A4]|uniref:pentapeptide repeat-containing protein n=1 Tax=Microcoleus sp. N3A4 TaxID=3055379 RepID=UPI002FD6BE37